MSAYRESQTFWAYRDKDGKLATHLFDGQAPATKALVDVLVRPIRNDHPFTLGYDTSEPYSAYMKRSKDHTKTVRALAKKDIKELGYQLVTFCLVQYVGPKKEI